MLTPFFFQILYVRLAADEPEQFVYDRAQVQLLGGEHREALRQVEPHLVPEDRERPDAGAVLLGRAGVEDAADEVEILIHERRYGQARAHRQENPDRSVIEQFEADLSITA